MLIFDRAARVLAAPPSPGYHVNYKKAITQASAPTTIEPECADTLIDFIIDESVFLGMIATERMNTNEKPLAFVDMSNGLLRPGGCEQDDDDCDTGTITGTRKTLRTKEMKAVIPICDNFLEDNIEGAAFETHLLRMVGDVLANELEIWALMASLALNYSTPEVNSATMQLTDGVYEQLQNGHVLNGLSNPDGHRFISRCKLQAMMQALPTKYRKNRDLRIFMPDDMIWDWQGVLAANNSALSFGQFTDDQEGRIGRTPFISLPLLPTDIVTCSFGSQAGNGTFMFLADPKNIVWGIQRDMTFERERKGCQGRTYLIWTIRVDILIMNEDATVLFDCMDVGNCEECPCP